MVLTAAINTLNTTIGKAIGRIEGVLATSEQAQKASLVLGQSLDGVRASLGADLKQLNGTIGQRLQVGISTLNAGLQGNVQSASYGKEIIQTLRHGCRGVHELHKVL